MHSPKIPSQTTGPGSVYPEGAELYRTVFTEGFDCMAISDNGMIVDVNDATLHTFGYSRAELVGTRLVDLVAPEARPAVASVIATNREARYELPFMRQDGSRFDAEALGKAILLGGKLLRLTMLRDLTERRHSEASLHNNQVKLGLAMQMARLGHWELDLADQQFTFDDSFLRLLGTSVEQEGGRSMTATDYANRFIPPEEIEIVRQEIAAATAATDPDYRRQIEHSFYRTDGSPGVMLVNIAIVKDTTGRTIRTYGINQDITQRRQDEEQRTRLEEQLQHAQKMDALGTLAGGIAHDFNNILTGLLGHLQLAEMDLAAFHPARAGLREASKAGRRARDLVARILAFGRRGPQDRQSRPIGPVVQEALQLLRASLPATIEIKTSLAPDLPPVLCDTAQIHQVIMNLGTNAAHAMSDQAGVLSVTLERVTPTPSLRKQHPQVQPHHVIRLSVSDTGVGIAENVLPRIFEPFFTTKRTGEGTGLGLTMVYSIVQDHQGAITTASTLGVGTTLSLYFPEAPASATLSVSASPFGQAMLPFGRGRRVMLVEDDDTVRSVSLGMFRRLGFVPEGFADPLAALAAFRARPDDFCTVVTDLTMPGMTGTELAGKILALRPGLPLILASGHLNTETTQHGVRHVIAKPFDIDEFARLLRSALGEPAP
jgi:PAS domain S-box-containing protein